MNSSLSLSLGLAPIFVATSSTDVTTLVNMALFYDFTDANTMTLNGSGIAQVNDRSGNTRHATQAISSQQPTLIFNAIGTKSVARFNTSNTSKLSFNGSFVVSSNYLIVIATTVNGGGTSGGTLIGGSTVGGNENLTLVRNSTNLFYSQYSNDYSWNTLVNSGNLEIISILSDGTGKAGYQNGNLIGSTSNTTQLNGWNGAALGHRSDADWRLTGDIVYVMFAVGANATNINRQILEGWSAWQLNLAGNLPIAHPYKDAAP